LQVQKDFTYNVKISYYKTDTIKRIAYLHKTNICPLITSRATAQKLKGVVKRMIIMALIWPMIASEK